MAVNVNNFNSSEENLYKINENPLAGDGNFLKVVPDARLMLDIIENYAYTEKSKT